MEPKIAQSHSLQVVVDNHSIPGKRPLRVKPKHLRRSLMQIAAMTMQQHQSAADAARAINEPGITDKTVHECATLILMRRMERIEAILGESHRVLVVTAPKVISETRKLSAVKMPAKVVAVPSREPDHARKAA